MTLTATPANQQQRAVRRIFTNRAVQLLNEIEGLIRGYVFIWGDPEHVDAYDTWFDRARPPETTTNDGMQVRPMFYEHTMDGVVRKEVVGRIDRVWFDDVGMAYEGHLYRSSPFFPRIVGELQRHELKTSSGSTETADWRPDGSFEFWPFAELSLTKYPAEKRMPPTVLVRSTALQEAHEAPRSKAVPHSLTAAAAAQQHVTLHERSTGNIMPNALRMLTPDQQVLFDQFVQQSGIAPQDILDYLAQMAPPDASSGDANGGSAGGDAQMGGDQSQLSMSALLAGARSFVEQRKRDQENRAVRNDVDALKNLMTTFIDDQKKQTEALRNAPPAQSSQRRGTQAQGGANITDMKDLRTAHLSASDMWFIRAVLNGAKQPTTEHFDRAMAHKTFGLIERDTLKFDAEFKTTIRSSYKDVDALMRSSSIRADDFMASDISGQGQDWVSTFFATEIWEKARNEVVLLNEMRSRGLHEIEVPQGAKEATVFLEGNDPTWYTTAQANDKDAVNQTEVVVNINYVTTASVTITPGQLTSAVAYTDILEEDSMIPIAPQLNKQYQAGALEVIEYVMINGDTATGANTNINLIDGTPGTGLAKPAYLVSNGILKLPLVTTTSLGRDAGGAFNENTFQATLKKLPKQVRGQKAKMLWLMDTDTYETALTFAAFKTMDVAGQAYTLLTGELPPKVSGVKPLQSGQMDVANSAGKIPAAGGTLGRLAAVFCPYWALVWKRQLTFEQARAPLSQASLLVGSLRMALRYRSATAAAALSYNLPVTVSE